MFLKKKILILKKLEKVLLFIAIFLFVVILVLVYFCSNKAQENRQDDKIKDDDNEVNKEEEKEKEDTGEKIVEDAKNFNNSGNRISGIGGAVAYITGGVAASGAAVAATKLLKRNNLVNAKLKVSQKLGQEIDDTNESLEKIVENEEQEQLTEKGQKLLSPQEVSEDEKGVVAENQDNFEEDTLEVSSSKTIGVAKNNVEEALVNEESREKEKYS